MAQKVYADLLERIEQVSLLASTEGVLYWDMETGMPDGGAEYRGEQLSLLSGMVHEQFTDPVIAEWLETIEASDLVSDPLSDEAVNVREIRRQYDREVKLPKELVEEFTRVTAQAHIVWRDARAASDFSMFAPLLGRIVELSREKADAIASGATRYDTLMDAYEPGMTSVEMGKVFENLTKDVKPLIDAVVDSGRTPDRSIMKRDYAPDGQKILSQILAQAVGFDLNEGAIAESTHPFTSGLGRGDTRFTTRYYLNELNVSVFGTLHEAGHGLYDQGLPKDAYGLPCGESVSLGIHESQSRTWENYIGRSQAFWNYALPIARGVFPENLASVSVDDFYWAINDVQPSFIRVEADEATYNMHINLRFELEQKIISGDIEVADIPEAWNTRFTELMGITPESDADGCLQDVHWSGGMFGYFPTYTLGNLYGAQFFEKAREDLGDLDEQFAHGEFAPILGWLRENIHAHGQRYRASELIEHVTGKPLSHAPLVRHLKSKLGGLYGV
jgi:carboxypeptidase Taq